LSHFFPSNPFGHNLSSSLLIASKQGDQIGRIFCVLGDYLLWLVFWKIAEMASIFVLVSSEVKVFHKV
jgi:hypothetical protein